jgi:anaerobic selenocysteine-containing dehydrogenase
VFPTADGKAHFLPVAPVTVDVPEGSFVLSTRRGKQFNTMVHAERDPLTGAARDALFMAGVDAGRLGVGPGDHVLVRSAHGELAARVLISELRPGNVQVFFPEGNVLLGAGRRDAASGVPDYNAVVTVEPLGRAS